MITEEQCERLMEVLVKEYGNDLPSPVHCPIEFAFKLRLLKYHQAEIWAEIVGDSYSV